MTALFLVAGSVGNSGWASKLGSSPQSFAYIVFRLLPTRVVVTGAYALLILRAGRDLLGNAEDEWKVSEKHRAALRLRWSDPAQREKQSVKTKAQWADPVMREKMSAAVADPVVRAKLATAIRATWADPIARKRRTESIKASRNTPASREKAAAASRARWADPTARAKMIARIRAANARRTGAQK